MNVAQGSLEEARYYLILADDLGYMDNCLLMAYVEEISRLLERYIERIRCS
jgi:four helix bundle protein